MNTVVLTGTGTETPAQAFLNRKVVSSSSVAHEVEDYRQFLDRRVPVESLRRKSASLTPVNPIPHPSRGCGKLTQGVRGKWEEDDFATSKIQKGSLGEETSERGSLQEKGSEEGNKLKKKRS